MKQPDENILKCPHPTCRIPIACDGKGIVPYHLMRLLDRGLSKCDGVGLKGEKIKEKKSK